MKNIFILLLIVSFFGCDKENNQSQLSNSNTDIDIQAELESIEEIRSAIQLTIKEKRYPDLGEFTTPDYKSVSPGSEDWLEYKRLREEPFG